MIIMTREMLQNHSALIKGVLERVTLHMNKNKV